MQLRYNRKLLQFATLFLCLMIPSVAFAHHPHDRICLLEISPEYPSDRTVFISIRPVGDHFGRLLKSTDGGESWIELYAGLVNKSYLTSIAISPGFSVDQTMFLGTSGDGVFKSVDGGLSWENTDATRQVKNISLLTISPNYLDDQVIVAASGNGGLFRSDDGGKQWARILTDDKRITSIAFSRGKDGMRLVAGDSDGAVFMTSDGGLSWDSHSVTQGSAITAIACFNQPGSGSKCLVGTQEEGFFEYGQSSAPIPVSLGGPSEAGSGRFEPITSITIAPPDGNGPSKVIATSWSKAVFVSGDQGRTWQLHDKGVTTHWQADEQNEPHFSHVGLAKTSSGNTTLFLSGFAGLFKSEDSGKTWREMETLVTKRAEAIAISPDYSSSRTIAIASQFGGAYIGDDGGRNWNAANHGLKEIYLWAIAISPAFATDKTIFGASNETFYRMTADRRIWDKYDFRGKYWVRRIEKLMGKKPRPKLFPLHIVMPPNFETDPVIYLGTRYNGVYLSEDRGATWSNVWDAKGGWVSSLVISPSFTQDGTLFAAVAINGEDSAVYKTTDRGRSWQRVGENVNAVLAKNPDAKAKLAISPEYDTDKTVFVGTVDGLFQSNDAGKSWSQPLDPSAVENGYVRAIAISPNYGEDGTVLVSVKGSGLFKSVDRGKHFSELGSRPSSKAYQYQSLVFSDDFENDNTILGIAQGEVLRSTDGGHTWAVLPRPVRYEDQNPYLKYEGQWRTEQEGRWERALGKINSATTVTVSNHPQDRVTLHFTGSEIRLQAKLAGGPEGIRIYVDGKPQTGFDVHENEIRIANLGSGPHTVTVENASGERMEIDYFDIF